MAPLQLLGALEGSLPALQRAGPTALLLAAATLTSALLLLALNTAFATPNCAAHVLTAVLGNAGGLHPHAAQLVALWAALRDLLPEYVLEGLGRGEEVEPHLKQASERASQGGTRTHQHAAT